MLDDNDVDEHDTPKTNGNRTTNTVVVNNVVVGAGPVGLAAALLLAEQGHEVTVLEGKAQPSFSDANSYPIGVNPRGQATLRRIDPALLDALRGEAEVVEGWRIYAGRRLVAQLPSGTVLSTTRATLTRLLWERAEQDPRITLAPGHRLTGLDVAAQTLHVETPDGAVQLRAGLVLACDGVWSATRRALEGQVAAFVPEVEGWGVRFRVLYSQPGASAPGLDPARHYIFGSKGIYTATLRDDVWAVVTSAVEGAPETDLLTATEATPGRISLLRKHIHDHAPLAEPLLREEDYAAFFGRDDCTGAVVECPTLHVGEWLVLLGDAAHSVGPPTGEGVNAGLEDAALLAKHLAAGTPTPLADYSAARLPDVHALGAYARHLMRGIATRDPAARAAGIVLRITNAVSGRLGSPAGRVEEQLFGPGSGTTPYREILQPWLDQRARVYPRAYRVAAAFGRARVRLSRRS